MYSFGQKLLDIVFLEYGLRLDNIDTWLTYPPKPELGDFAFSCFGIAKELKISPNEVAANLATALDKQKDVFLNALATGGYLNFSLTDEFYIYGLSTMDLSDKEPNGETIVVDYIGANAGKPLHIGHLCTPSLGQSVINMYKHLGYDVISDSHFGDWGGIFGKLIYAYKTYNKIDNEISLSEFGIKHLLYLYQKVNSEIEREEKLILTIEKEGLNIINNNLINYSSLNENEKTLIKNINLYTKEKDYNNITLFLNLLLDIKTLKNEELDLLLAIKNSLNYVELNCRKEFQKLSQGDPENVELWKKFTSISIAEVQKQLKDELNVEPQYNIGESFYEGLNLPRPNNEDYPELEFNMKDIVKELLTSGVATKNEDLSVGVIFPDEAKIPSCVLQKKDGTGLYLTSDLSSIKYRKRVWNPSKIIYFVDVRQQLHLKQAFYIAHKAWPELENTELFHAYNGFIKLKEGAMSTRKGTVIFLKDLIEEGYKKTAEILESKGRKLSEVNIKAITIAAIKYSYLSQDREKDVVFDWEKALNFEGNSGPYIQYAYVRASKIINSPLLSGEGSGVRAITGMKLSQNDKRMIKKLLEFEKKVLESAGKYKPSIIAQYSYELASEFNTFYVHTPKILEEKNDNLRSFRLGIIDKTKEILKKSFELLAINMPDEM